MNVSPNELRKETVKTLREVNEALKSKASERAEMKIPLLLAKAQCLNTLTLLNEKR